MAIDEEKLMEEVLSEVEDLTEEELAAEASKILERKEKQKEYRQKQEKSPEQIEKQKEYRKKKYARDKAILERYNALTEPDTGEDTAESESEPEVEF